MPRKLLQGLAIGAALIVLLIILAVRLEPPNDARIRAFVEAEAAREGARVDTVFVEHRNVRGREATFQLNIGLRRPGGTYYVPIRPDEHPHEIPEFDWEARDTVRRILEGTDGARLRKLAGLTGDDESWLGAHLLRELRQPHEDVSFVRGRVVGKRSGMSWTLTLEMNPDTGRFGDRRRSLDDFEGRRIVVNRPDDRAAIAQLSQRLGEIRDRLEKSTGALVRERMSEVLALFRPGAFFTGKAVPSNRFASESTDPVEVYVEVTEVRPDEDPPRLSALVRNDGGWEESRLYDGAVVYDGASGALRLRLGSSFNQAIHDAGPFVAEGVYPYGTDRRDGDEVLEFDIREGSLVWKPADGDSARLTLVAGRGENAPDAVKARLTGRRNALVEATRPGRLYTGTITDRRSGVSSQWVLQFDAPPGPDLDHIPLGAILEERDGRRRAVALTGHLVPNSRRANNVPIRLDPKNANDDMPELLKEGDDEFGAALVALRFEGGRLEGQNNRCVFRFEPAPPQLAEERRRAAEEKRRADEDEFLGLIRSGANYQGRAEGFTPNESVRLEIRRVENRGELVELQIAVGGQTEPFDYYSGRLVVADRAVLLERARNPGRTFFPGNNPQDRFKAQWLGRSETREARLTVEDGHLVLASAQPNRRWRLKFALNP